MKRICLMLLLFTILLLLVACEQSVSKTSKTDNKTTGSGVEHFDLPVDGADPSVDSADSPSAPITEASPIVGTWHYDKSSQDCYLAFYEDGTGWIHYYQNYGQNTGLTGYVNKGIRSWSYNPNTQTLGITIAGNTIAGINQDASYSFVVKELTENTLMIDKNGAYDPVVPIKKILTKGSAQSLPHVSD